MVSIINFKDSLKNCRTDSFSADMLKASPAEAIKFFVKFIDNMLTGLFNELLMEKNDEISLVAIGGYGREELCPHSDIDLLILFEGDRNDESVARIVRALWDTGLPLGCVVRSISDCRRIMGEDVATDTALLDARCLAGSRHMFRQLINQVVEPSFRRRKNWYLDEINKSIHEDVNAADTSLYTVEPHLKSGICTLRDCQRMVWGMRVADNRFTVHGNRYYLSFDQKHRHVFEAAYERLLAIRCALHMTADRRLDILEISEQRSVAQYLGFGDDHAGMLMEVFFRTVQNVKQLLQLYIETAEAKKHLFQTVRWAIGSTGIGSRICLLDGYLSYHGYIPASEKNSVKWVLEVYLLSLQYQALPNVKLENHIRKVAEEFIDREIDYQEISGLFIELMSVKMPLGKVLRSMYETGFLYLLLPEFRSIKCKVEYDTYHEFTVDQHTLYAFSLIDNIEKELVDHAVDAFKAIDDIFVLRMAVLLHDVGKSAGGHHASSGAMISVNVADRFGFNERKRDQIAFLIEYHLELSLLAFRREPEEYTISAFADIVNNRRNLDYLYILTIIDIKSVGRKTWTVWKGMQLDAVYDRVRKYLNDDKNIRFDLHPYNNIQKDMQKYAPLFESIEGTNAINIAVEKYAGFERLIVVGFDRQGFFADIAGCLSSEGYNILSAQIATEKNRVFDIFHAEPDRMVRIESSQHVKNIIKKWNLVLDKKNTTQELIDERMRMYPPKMQRRSNKVKSEVIISNDISMEYTVLEIRTADKFGLLFKVARCLSENRINIVSAKLSTRVAQAIDVFYVLGADGKKISDEAACAHVHELLKECLNSNY